MCIGGSTTTKKQYYEESNKQEKADLITVDHNVILQHNIFPMFYNQKYRVAPLPKVFVRGTIPWAVYI